MVIYFVRHGHPNYVLDRLTELGKKQAAAAAERLRDSGIERIYSSSSGRAAETAGFTADVLGLPITNQFDFMRELSWRLDNGEQLDFLGVPTLYVENGESLNDENWREKDPYCRSKTVETIERVTSGFDAWLSELGYERDGEYYRVVGDDTDHVVAMFSHLGASTAVLSHLFNIPFPKFCSMSTIDFTAITAVSFSNEKGKLISPKIILLNDAKHLSGIEGEKIYG